MLLRKMLLGKIHRATVTGANVEYMGSITIDPLLLEASGIDVLEEVEVWDTNNGERFTTYVLPGREGSGEVVLNGAAARRVQVGDKVIIAAFGLVEAGASGKHKANLVIVDAQNRVTQVFEYSADLAMRTVELKEIK
jgi:aspartate 1-decarboxylase